MPKTAIFKGFSTLSGFWRKSSHGLGIFDSLKWKLRLSLKSPRKPHVREKSGTHFFDFFCKRGKIFEWSIQSAVNFSSWLGPMDFILHNLIVLNGLNNLAAMWHMLDHSKIIKMPFWMIQIAKNEVFGHFLEFETSERLDIADFDSSECFPTFGKAARSWRIIQTLQKCCFKWLKVPKKCFGRFVEFGLFDWFVIANGEMEKVKKSKRSLTRLMTLCYQVEQCHLLKESDKSCQVYR